VEVDADPLGGLRARVARRSGVGASAVAGGQGDADVEDLAGVADQLGVAFQADPAELLVGRAGLGQEGGPGVSARLRAFWEAA
jgi:hypothetical protein